MSIFGSDNTMGHFNINHVEVIAKREETPWEFMAVRRSDGGSAVYIVPKSSSITNVKFPTNFKYKVGFVLVLIAVLLAFLLSALASLVFIIVISISMAITAFTSRVCELPYFTDFFYGDGVKMVKPIDYPLVKFNLTEFGKDKFIATNIYTRAFGKGVSGAVNNMEKSYYHNKAFFQNTYAILKNNSEVIIDKDAFKNYKAAIEEGNSNQAKRTSKNALKSKSNKQIEAPKNSLLDVYPKPVEELAYLKSYNVTTYHNARYCVKPHVKNYHNFNKILDIGAQYEQLNQQQMADYSVCVKELVSAHKIKSSFLNDSGQTEQVKLYEKIYSNVDTIMDKIIMERSQASKDQLTVINRFLEDKYAQSLNK